MKTNTRVLLKAWSISILSCLICFAAATLSASGQQKEKDKVLVSVDKTAWADDGSLVCSIRVQAPPSRAIDLITWRDVPGQKPIAMPFSLAGSYLIDSTTGAKIPALTRLPPKPFFGVLSLIVHLAPNGWIHMGVAFLLPPPPPPGPGGIPQPYKLTLYAPMDAKPFSLPPLLPKS